MENNQSLQKILQEIKDRAEKEAAEITRDAEEQIEEMKRKFEIRKKEFLDSEKEKYVQEGEKEKVSILTQTRIKMKKDILNKKRNLVDSIINGAAEKLHNLSEKQHRKFLEKLLEKSVESGNEEVIPGSAEKALNAAFINEINKKNGWNLKLSSAGPGAEKGFVLRAENCETVVDFESIKEFIREKKEPEIVKELFSEFEE